VVTAWASRGIELAGQAQGKSRSTTDHDRDARDIPQDAKGCWHNGVEMPCSPAVGSSAQVAPEAGSRADSFRFRGKNLLQRS